MTLSDSSKYGNLSETLIEVFLPRNQEVIDTFAGFADPQGAMLGQKSAEPATALTIGQESQGGFVLRQVGGVTPLAILSLSVSKSL